MTLEERIVAVARAYVDFRFGGTRKYDQMDEVAKRGFRGVVRPWVRDAFPELFETPPRPVVLEAAHDDTRLDARA